jgi:hypothetical protein
MLVVMTLLIRQLDGPTARRPGRTPPFIVCFHPFVHVRGIADVEGAVRASDDVNDEGA